MAAKRCIEFFKKQNKTRTSRGESGVTCNQTNVRHQNYTERFRKDLLVRILAENFLASIRHNTTATIRHR